MGLEPDAIDLKYTRGDTEPIGFTVTNKAGTPQNVSANTYELTVNTLADGDDPNSVELFVIPSTFLTDGSDGKILFSPSVANSDQVAKLYFYDISKVTPKVHTVAKGKFTFLKQINLP